MKAYAEVTFQDFDPFAQKNKIGFECWWKVNEGYPRLNAVFDNTLIQ